MPSVHARFLGRSVQPTRCEICPGFSRKPRRSATQRKIDPAVFLAARLAPDMLPLTRQVQIACDHRQELQPRG